LTTEDRGHRKDARAHLGEIERFVGLLTDIKTDIFKSNHTSLLLSNMYSFRLCVKMRNMMHLRQRAAVKKPPSNPRLVNENGRINISAKGVRGWKIRYMYDFFTTMVDIKWRWNILIFIGGFVITWLIFATFYWIIGFSNGDYDANDALHKPCIKNMRTFLSAYLFSIETQSTIGYGVLYVTEECPMAYTCVLVQSIIGAALQAALAGLVVAKVRRGRKQNNTILFSSNACILADGLELKLVFRVADTRTIHAINANVKGYLFRKILSSEGQTIPIKHQIVNFSVEGGCKGLFLAWPQQIVHVIDEKSPFWSINKEEFYKEIFELVVVFFGEIATVGRPFETDVAYLPWDIKWGYKFQPMQHKIDNDFDRYSVDIANFNKILLTPTPTCSAKDLKSTVNRNISELPDYIRQNVKKPKPSPIFSRQNSVADKFLDAATANEHVQFSALPQ